MKILFSHFGIYKRDGWGRTFALAKALCNAGHSVTILTSSEKKGLFFNKYIDGKVCIIVFKDIVPQKILSKGFGIFSLINKVLFSLLSNNDVVHADSHRPNSYYPCIINKYFHNSKYVIEWWDNFGPDGQLPNKSRWFKIFLGKWEEKAEIKSKIIADGVVVLSKYMYKRALKVGLDKNKIILIQGGANIEDIKFTALGSFKIEKYKIELEYITFGFIGSGDNDISDIMPFIDAIRELQSKVKLKFINFGIPFSLSMKQNSGIEKILVEGGWIDYYSNNESAFLGAVDVFILIKREDVKNLSGWPNKLGDYLACGRPVLLNTYGDIKSFVEMYNPGVITVNYDKADISLKIEDICRGQYDLRALGNINRKLAETHLSWRHKAKLLENFYVSMG